MCSLLNDIPLMFQLVRPVQVQADRVIRIHTSLYQYLIELQRSNSAGNDIDSLLDVGCELSCAAIIMAQWRQAAIIPLSKQLALVVSLNRDAEIYKN